MAESEGRAPRSGPAVAKASAREWVLRQASPRRADRIAHRLRVLSAWARERRARVTVERLEVDAEALERLADAQARAEEELERVWTAFAHRYPRYLEETRERERILLRAIEAFEEGHAHPRDRRALRLCKLRRPPELLIQTLLGAPNG